VKHLKWKNLQWVIKKYAQNYVECGFFVLFLAWSEWKDNRLRGRGVRVDDFKSSYLSGVGSIPRRCFGSLARRKVVKYWCYFPGTMVRKLHAYMTEILLEKGVKWNKQNFATLSFCTIKMIFPYNKVKEWSEKLQTSYCFL
jgi:hypothetical protein